MMNEKKDTLAPLKDVIRGLFKDESLPFNPDDARIWEVWEEVAGEAVAKNARPIWIKKGLLKVNVSDPIWLQELKFAGETIRSNLNQKLGRIAVQKIEFRLGP